MVTYHDLLKADLTPLEEAVTKWGTVPGKIRQVETNFRNQLETPLTKADWEGKAGDQALKAVRSIAKQLTEWSEEAADVHALLKDAHEKFKAAQKTVKDYKKLIDEDKHLSIDGQGKITYKAANADDLDAAALQGQAKAYQQAVADYQRAIQTAVGDATGADDVLSWILTQDFNGRGKGFTGDGYHSIKDGIAGRKKALADLKTLTDIAESEGRFSPEQLKKANTILARHEGDPFFAEKFATGLGARGTLEFWEQATDDTEPGDARAKDLEKLQKSLGFTLATASHSDSDAMAKWKREIVELGPERISKEGPFGKPYGFHVMSSLLRYGTYDADFLVDYGKGVKDPNAKDGRSGGLIEFDRKHKDDLQDFWESDWGKPNLDFAKKAEQGFDPMGGYMAALGNNPEAGQEVFHRKEYLARSGLEANPDLLYLLKEREWPNEEGYKDFGHALEAASLGHPHGRPELGLQRTENSANVASQVISTIGKGESGFVAEHPQLLESFAKIGAGYIDDIDHGVINFGDTQGNAGMLEKAFHNSQSGHITLNDGTALGFLREVGASQQGYDILSAAQHHYTTSAITAHSEPGDELSTILEAGAKTHGALNEARAYSIQDDINNEKEDAEEEITGKGEWKKALFSQGIGLVAGAASAPFGGPTTSAGVAIAVPALIETGAGLIETATGFSIDDNVEKKIKEAEEKIDIEGVRTKEDFHDQAEVRAANALDVYAALHPELQNSDWFIDTKRNIETAYNNGRHSIDARDRD
ncbi:hypothetical protein IHE55_22050 [Streptomyces pactum]|uniref:AG2 protein n=1 Tax=Streptomyces pactum TaxID=68249 RepID=A0ABS0NQ33_9ACTN|nr:DUF6571 family protein [Streptomyces pactum]MBH5337296.1 hypothetical protein [Streptomyces pactum]